jgi:hypothetical protein
MAPGLVELDIDKKDDDEQNEIFSDRQSKSNCYKRLLG